MVLSPIREDIGRSVHNLVVELESTLRRADFDLAAKHWGIYAERGRNFPTRRVPNLPQHNVQRPLVGPYDAEYDTFQGPAEARAGTLVDATVRIVNRSWRVWTASPRMALFFSAITGSTRMAAWSSRMACVAPCLAPSRRARAPSPRSEFSAPISFQVVAAGSIGVVWAAPSIGTMFVALLATGFFLFGIGNGRLVVNSQQAAQAVSDAIDKFIKQHPDDITPEFVGVVNVLKLDKPALVWTYGSDICRYRRHRSQSVGQMKSSVAV